MGLKRYSISVGLFVALATYTVAYSQVPHDAYANYYFRSLQVEDGLSQNSIYAIFQDRQGYMWFGTQDGLNRYDGHTFKIFKKNTNDPRSLGNNTVTDITQDHEGQIWVGTGDGAFVYDQFNENFTTY